ncbi:MAG: hypothetical protein HPY66_3069 [Firmicutes bacterium]|nr:hypothetical protein [Bacillota bacterium]
MDKPLSKLYLFNLDNLLLVIKHLYSDTGCPAKNQQGIIRSLVLMLDCDEHSITKWAPKVASDRLLCAACGFEFGKAPSYSSYYDFINRIWLASHKQHVKKKLKPKSFYAKPRKKLKAGQKLPPKHAGVITKLASLAYRGKLREERPEKIFQEFLARCIVDQSAQMGILGNINRFSIAMDGSCYNSGASHTGVKICDCQSKGIYKCQCPRRYSDPDATWGWDSYHEEYFYGDTLFSVTASDSPYDLPIYLRIAQAPRHDSILTIFALNEVRKLYPDITFKNFLADGAMDNYPTYRLFHQWDMIPFIPLDSNARVDYSKPHPGILCFDNAGKCRSSKQRFARATFAAVNIHLDAWVKHTGFSIIDLLDQNSGIAA